MKFLTVAAAIFASTSLAVPTNPNTGGSCVPNPNHSSGGGHSSSTGSGGHSSSGSGGHSSSGSGGHTSTGGNTSSGPATTTSGSNTGGNTSSGPATTTSGSNTGGNTSSGPATTTSGSNTGSNTSSGPATTSTGNPGNGGEFHCPGGLYSNPQCCAADILGVLGIDCESPKRPLTSGDDFKAVCAATGKEAKCCVLGVAGESVLCEDAPGGGNPTGGNPTSAPGGGNPTSAPGGGNPTSSAPGGSNPTSAPGGGSPTSSAPGGNPTSAPGGGEFHCPGGLYSNPQCCSADVAGAVGVDCDTPKRPLNSGDDFKAVCAATGKQAKCCVVPVLGQALLCQNAPGGGNPTSGPGGNPTSAPGGGNPTSAPGGGNPTSAPGGGNPTSSAPGGNPTSSAPGGNPTSAPGGGKSLTCPKGGLYTNPQCCSVDVLGVADIDCQPPSNVSPSAFGQSCAAEGKSARCCVLAVAGQAVLCQKPIGA